jgi:hypothetical protein
MRLSSSILLVSAALPAVFAMGCSKAPTVAAEPAAPPAHHHHAPHGGTAVELGDEAYHIELVVDDSTGSLQAYVLDAEMENFVRSSNPTLEVTATAGGATHVINLAAVANDETGEVVGDTSLFEANADWLKTTPSFSGTLRSVTIRGTAFTDVKFNFPKGSDSGH